MSEYFSRIQALLDNIRQELESIIRRVTWAFLHIIDDGRVPFKDWEDLELEEKNIHVRSPHSLRWQSYGLRVVPERLEGGGRG